MLPDKQHFENESAGWGGGTCCRLTRRNGQVEQKEDMFARHLTTGGFSSCLLRAHHCLYSSWFTRKLRGSYVFGLQKCRVPSVKGLQKHTCGFRKNCVFLGESVTPRSEERDPTPHDVSGRMCPGVCLYSR